MLISDFIDIEKDKELYFEMIAYISNAFSYKAGMRADIDNIYETDKYTFYRIAKESDSYNNNMICFSDITSEIYSKRAMGIIIKAESDTELCDKVKKILIRHYNDIYQIVKLKKTSKQIAEKVVYDLLKRNPSPSETTTYDILILYMIIKFINKEELNEFYTEFIEYQLYLRKEMMIETNSKEYLKKIIQENKELGNKIAERLKSKHLLVYGYEEMYNLKIKEVKDYVKIVSMIFDNEEISISRLISEIKFEYNDLVEFFCFYSCLYRDMNVERTLNILMSSIIIKSLVKRYKEIRNVFFENNKETLYLNLEIMENKIKELFSENEKIKKEMLELSNKYNDLDNNYTREVNKIKKSYDKNIQLNENDINKLVRENEKYKQENERTLLELSKLRSLFFDIESTTSTPADKNKDVDDCINGKRILVVGGADRWRQKMKERYNHLLTLDGISENFDISVLKDIDYIFFYAGYMNHATYYRIINYIKVNNIPFGYIGKTNIELVEQDMAEQLSNQFDK